MHKALATAATRTVCRYPFTLLHQDLLFKSAPDRVTTYYDEIEV